MHFLKKMFVKQSTGTTKNVHHITVYCAHACDSYLSSCNSQGPG